MPAADRPFSVFALAAVAALGGVWVLTGTLGLRPPDTYPVGDLKLSPDLVRLFWLAWGVMLIVSAVMIVLLRRQGWALLMISTGVGLLAALWQWWIGNLEPVRMAILVVTAFYLNARQVRELFLESRERATFVPLAPPEADQG